VSKKLNAIHCGESTYQYPFIQLFILLSLRCGIWSRRSTFIFGSTSTFGQFLKQPLAQVCVLTLRNRDIELKHLPLFPSPSNYRDQSGHSSTAASERMGSAYCYRILYVRVLQTPSVSVQDAWKCLGNAVAICLDFVCCLSRVCQSYPTRQDQLSTRSRRECARCTIPRSSPGQHRDNMQQA